MPQTFFGPYDERNQDYANSGNANLGRFPLGHTLILPDDRQYRFCLNDATVEIAGRLYQSVAAVADHTTRPADVARAIDAVLASATLTGTAAAIDIYAEGVFHTGDLVGEGYTYRIKRAFTAGAAHEASVASGVLTVNFAAGEMIQVALDTTSSVTFTRNRYHQVLIAAAPPTAAVTGVSPGVAAANRFYWSQVKGYAAVLASGTLRAGLPVMAGITTAGSVESTKRRIQVGASTTLVLTSNGSFAFLDSGGVTTGFSILAVSSSVAAQGIDITGGIAQNGPTVGICVKANPTGDHALIDLAIV